MKKIIVGILVSIITLNSSFGDVTEERKPETFSIQLIKIGNAPNIHSEEFIKNPRVFLDSLNSSEVTIEPCGAYDANIGDTAFFNIVNESNRSTFVIKLTMVELDAVTVEMTWFHYSPKKTIEVNVTESRSITSPNYIIQSSKPSSTTILTDHWITIAGYPLKNDERLMLRITN